ncbi:hypothetical protein MMC06_004147 [Schaereria dolodes]|nr:hypothetical protein [Schaereria dolodes]
MIGRLLQTAASTFTPHPSSRPQTPLESATEEVHTYSLLFPDKSVLSNAQDSVSSFHSASAPATAEEAANFDDRGGLRVNYPESIRILIAQDANSRYQQPQVLYDSKPPAKTTQRHYDGPSGANRGATYKGTAIQSPLQSPSRLTHSRRSSLFQSSPRPGELSPISPKSFHFGLHGSFGENPLRNSATELETDRYETSQGKAAREDREETEALLGCMFGAPGFRLEPSTKLHVLPHAPSDITKTTDGSPSVPRPTSSRDIPRKMTPLTRSTSAADISMDATRDNRKFSSRGSKASKSSIVITKMFAMDLPESLLASNHRDPLKKTKASAACEAQSLSALGKEGAGEKNRPNQKKTPMFAMAIILQLPAERQHIRSCQSLLSTSVTGSWAVDPLSGLLSPTVIEASTNRFTGPAFSQLSRQDNDSDCHIAHVLAQWSVILRAAEALEKSARETLYTLLRSSDLTEENSPLPTSRTEATKPKKVRQPSQQSVQVEPGCLQSSSTIQKAVAIAARRVTDSLRTRRVTTGQGRWGAWREEARWVGRWAGGRDQNFFFFNLLTAFLGCHTAWLDTFGPRWHRRQHTIRQPNRNREGGLVQQRTIIISSHKMAARRLIFLLSAFLPSTRILPNLEPSQWPLTLQSPSPPSVPVTRTHSLRRTINRRPRGSLKVGTETSSHSRSVSFSLKDVSSSLKREQSDHHLNQRKNRQVQGTSSVPGCAIAIPNADLHSRKTSISTVIADTTIPVPHFSNSRAEYNSSKAEAPRRGSSGSLASIALAHTLQRSESAGLSSISGSNGRWGSMISGFWSNRRGSSTDDSDVLASSQEGLGITSARDYVPRSLTGGKLVHMVDETPGHLIARPPTRGNMFLEDPPSPTTIRDPAYGSEGGQNQEAATPARDIPERPKTEHPSIKFSIDENDGAIDIDMPIVRSLSSSLTSSFNSLRFGPTASNSFQEHFAPYGRPSTPDSPKPRSEPPMEVAGWLKAYHPDFVLQAVRPYEALDEDIKRSMREEAELVLSPDSSEQAEVGDERWTDICTTLVADTSNFSVRRLRLRRKLASHDDHSTKRYEEDLIDEPVMDLDSTLIDAVERVLARSSQSSRAQSRAPSRAPSPSGHEGQQTYTADYSATEIPRSECRKMVLGALEQVVRSVTAEQARNEHGGKGKPIGAHHGDREGRGERFMADSTLREGVRKWLHDVENT